MESATADPGAGAKADRAAEAPDATFTLAVTKLSGDPLVQVQVPCSCTVAEVQHQIFEAAGLDRRTLGVQLVHGGNILDLDSTVGELGFQSGTVVKVSALISESPSFEIHVLANNHRRGAIGQYFHFHRGAAWTLEANGLIRGELQNMRSGEKGKAVLWGQPNGGNMGDAHGRFDPQPPGRGRMQFEVGDVLRFTQRRKSCDVIQVLADNHAHGPTERGMYFHFARSDVPWLEQSMALTGDLVNRRSGERGLAMLWGKPNGGAAGNAHGRFEPLAAKRVGQFQVGDELQFEAC